MTVNIHVTSQSFRVKVSPCGQLIEAAHSVQWLLTPFMTKYYDRAARRFLPGKRYRYYNQKTQLLHLPRYYLKEFLSSLDSYQIKYKVRPIAPPNGLDISFNMREGFTTKNDRQKESINHLVESKDPVKGLSLQTGGGKTITSLVYIQKAGKRAMIGVQGHLDQWKNAILEWTDMTKDDIFVIKGGPSVTKLLTRIDKTLFPKIIIYSIGTLRPYSQDADQYENYPGFDDLAKKLKVGIRVVDEGHLNFYTNYIMDLRLNVASTVILTATFDVSDPVVKKIFDSHYPSSMRFGERHYKKYVGVTGYGYRSGYGDIPSRAYQGKDGYSQIKLEKWLLHPKRIHKLAWIIRTIYLPIIHEKYINIKEHGHKLLVLCEMVEMCEVIAKALRKEFPELVVNIFVGETEDEVIGFSDIIVSTTRSSGTARDIKKLITVIQTSSIRSAPQNIQNLGRLREIEGHEPQFAYIFNKSIPQHVTHHNVREELFRPRAKLFKIIDIHE